MIPIIGSTSTPYLPVVDQRSQKILRDLVIGRQDQLRVVAYEPGDLEEIQEQTGCLDEGDEKYKRILNLDDILGEVFLRLKDVLDEELTDGVVELALKDVLRTYGGIDEPQSGKSIPHVGRSMMQDEKLELSPEWFVLNRLRLQRLESHLRPTQRELMSYMQDGLSAEEIALNALRVPKGVKVSIQRLAKSIKEKLDEVNKPPPHHSVDPDRWATLTTRQRQVMELYLLGLGHKEISVQPEIGLSTESLSGYLQLVRRKLGLSQQEAFQIHREQKLEKQQSDINSIRRVLLNFIYEENIPLSKNDESQELYEQKLFLTVCRILPLLTTKQREVVKLMMKGYRNFEIAEKTNTCRESVFSMLTKARKTLIEGMKELEIAIAPKGIDQVKWIRLLPQERRMIELYISGLNPVEIVEKLGDGTSLRYVDNNLFKAREKLGFSFNDLYTLQCEEKIKEHKSDPSNISKCMLSLIYPDGIPNAPEVITQEDYESEIFKNACRLLTRLDTSVSIRPFKLFIQGISKPKIVEITKLPIDKVTYSIKKVAEQLYKMLERLEIFPAPDGIDQIKWVSLLPQKRLVIGLFLLGLSPKEIQVEFGFKNLQQSYQAIYHAKKDLGLAKEDVQALRSKHKAK